MIRESVAIALGALLLTNPAPGVSQRRDKEKEFAFVIFLQGLTPEYRAKLEEVDKVMAALSTPPAESGPLAIDDRWREECERILADLNKELR
jgi:hypothetical protein